MTNNFMDNKGLIHVQGPWITTCSLSINYSAAPSPNWSTPNNDCTTMLKVNPFKFKRK